MDNITNLIIKNEGIIYKIINKYKNYFEIEDLYQVAAIGLIKAYKNYNETYNAKFISYAYPYILGEVIKYINEFRSIKVNKQTRVMYSHILKSKELLAQKLMKEPSNYELSLFLEMDEGLINEIMEANQVVDSLDKIVSEDDMNFELYNKFGYYDKDVENYPLKAELAKLSSDERQIILARYYENKSQKEVGEELGMYQVEVSRKEKKILQRLRDNIAA